MKLITSLITLALALSTIATPLGNHAIFRRHTGVPANNARRYILQSRMDAPPACIAKASSSLNSTDLPDLSNSTTSNSTTDVPENSTITDGTVDDTSNGGNSTVTDGAVDTGGNSTDTSSIGTSGNFTTDNSNSTDPGTPPRRRTLLPIATTTTTLAVDEEIVDLTFEWQSLCVVSGGSIIIDNSPCGQLSVVDGFNALLADADPCAQQDFADSIITFAKSSGIVNRADLVAFALKYRRHPRAAVSILGVVPSNLYCQQAPINPELNGIINAQTNGVNPGLFGSPTVPMIPFGSDGTCPFGTTADVSTCSCLPNPSSDTDTSALGDGSTGNSTTTDQSPTVSIDSSTVTDSSATASAENPNSTDSSAIASTESATADASLSANDATATDDSLSSASSVAASTDSAAVADSTAAATTGTSSTATDSSALPAASGSTSDISGNINDPNGRRRK